MGTRRQRASAWLLVLLLAAALVAALAPAALAQPRAATPGPLAQLAIQQAELTAGDGAAGDALGFVCAVDGDTALVGAPGASGKGAAYVFVRSGGAWSQQARLIAGDGAAGDEFGRSVAVDGDTAVVGAMRDDSLAGSAYVFARSGATWSQQSKLVAGDRGAGDRFGGSVDVSGDTVLAGANGAIVGTHDGQGAAYVFTRSGAVWTQQQKLTASGGLAYDYFGVAVALDGDSALVCAYGRDVAGRSSQGAMYSFTRNGTFWTQQQELVASDGAVGDYFGTSVDLSGATAVVGAPDAVSSRGTAYVFTAQGGTWSQQTILTPSDGAGNDRFGYGVAVSGDTALVGASDKTVDLRATQGAAYIFTNAGGAWTQQQKLTASDGEATDEFGYSAALSGRTAFAGAPFKTVIGHFQQGAAYAFGLPCTVTPSVVGGNGTISPATAAGYDYGSSPAFAFTPSAGYTVKEVKVDGAVVAMTGTNQYTFPALSADHAISVKFAKARPAITRLKPKAGKRGAVVTIKGTAFGATRGRTVVKFGKAKVKKYVSWSDTKIKVKVPRKARFGKDKVTVTTAGGKSAARNFRVKR